MNDKGEGVPAMTSRLRRVFAIAVVLCVAVIGQASGASASVVPDVAIDAPDPVTTGFYVSAFTGQSATQAFRAINSGSLVTVEIPINKVGNFNFTSLSLGLFGADGSDHPTGSVLASESISNSDVTTSPAWLRVNFSSPASIVAGQRYVLVLEDVGNTVYWRATNDSAFNGSTFVSSPSGWNSYVYSAGLRAFVDTSAPAPDVDVVPAAPPADVVQQVGLVETGGDCSRFTRDDLNWAGVPGDGWGQTWALWLNDGQGGVVCSRTLGYSQSLGRWIVR